MYIIGTLDKMAEITIEKLFDGPLSLGQGFDPSLIDENSSWKTLKRRMELEEFTQPI